MNMDNSNRIHVIDEPTRGSTFTHAPSKGPHSAAGDVSAQLISPLILFYTNFWQIIILALDRLGVAKPRAVFLVRVVLCAVVEW